MPSGSRDFCSKLLLSGILLIVQRSTLCGMTQHERLDGPDRTDGERHVPDTYSGEQFTES